MISYDNEKAHAVKNAKIIAIAPPVFYPEISSVLFFCSIISVTFLFMNFCNGSAGRPGMVRILPDKGLATAN